jgi:hypothetical protein
VVGDLVVVDEWFVAALGSPLIIDVHVVAVTQHLGELVDRHLLRRVAGGGPGAQAAIVEPEDGALCQSGLLLIRSYRW